MYYRLNDNIALRKWRYVDCAIYIKDMARPILEEETEDDVSKERIDN